MYQFDEMSLGIYIYVYIHTYIYMRILYMYIHTYIYIYHLSANSQFIIRLVQYSGTSNAVRIPICCRRLLSTPTRPGVKFRVTPSGAFNPIFRSILR